MRETERVLLDIFPAAACGKWLKRCRFSLHDRRRILSSSLCGKSEYSWLGVLPIILPIKRRSSAKRRVYGFRNLVKVIQCRVINYNDIPLKVP